MHLIGAPLAVMGLAIAGCAQGFAPAAPAVESPFHTLQVIIDDGNGPYGSGPSYTYGPWPGGSLYGSYCGGFGPIGAPFTAYPYAGYWSPCCGYPAW